QKSGQGDEAADSTNSTARRGNAVLVFVNPLYKKTAKAVLDGGNRGAGGIRQSLIFKTIVVKWLEERLAKGAR
ncbi:hypothetical protein, partial [Neisseria meningitidis]|uniref:hypothetical protein n=4 Tax=Neisseria meningitidis TaxID=487 RepID=UPI001611A8E1